MKRRDKVLKLMLLKTWVFGPAFRQLVLPMIIQQINTRGEPSL